MHSSFIQPLTARRLPNSHWNPSFQQHFKDQQFTKEQHEFYSRLVRISFSQFFSQLFQLLRLQFSKQNALKQMCSSSFKSVGQLFKVSNFDKS